MTAGFRSLRKNRGQRRFGPGRLPVEAAFVLKIQHRMFLH